MTRYLTKDLVYERERKRERRRRRVVKIGELSTGRNLKRPRVGAKIWGINTDRDIKWKY